jgi:hypothetical protein
MISRLTKSHEIEGLLHHPQRTLKWHRRDPNDPPLLGCNELTSWLGKKI